MSPDADAFEAELRTLIEEARRERQKHEQRLITVQRAIAEIDQKLESFQLTLDAYCAKYGLPKMDLRQAVEAENAQEYFGIGPKEMLLLWADQHDGQIVMSEACRFLAAAGLFQDARKAQGTLHRSATRMPELVKVRPGVFRRRTPTETRPYPLQVVNGSEPEEIDDLPF